VLFFSRNDLRFGRPGKITRRDGKAFERIHKRRGGSGRENKDMKKEGSK
jgi:hypothetical protein